MAEACSERPEIRAEVEELLAVADDVQGFLEPWHGGRAHVLIAPGQNLGAYRLGRLLGTGGMGEVYLGERADGEFHKKVAIKVARPGIAVGDVLDRFRAERQALADLDYPNIARLLDGGTANGVPFLVMEYVDGEPVDRYCDSRELSIDRRLRLFLDICGAVQHAHRNLIVHRDLKPGNILVDDDGQVKLLDFGIAKILTGDNDGASARTTVGPRAMTPAYASPEQLRGKRVTTATDIYSLGLILYELLCGCLPSSAERSRRALRQDGGREARWPSLIAERGTLAAARLRGEKNPLRLARRLAGDLDNIVGRSLRPEPERRYATVEQLAADLRRHQAGMPVTARPDSRRYRAAKFVRRNAAAVAVSAAAILALAVATAFSVLLFLRADRAKQAAELQRTRADEVSSFLQRMLASVDPMVAQGRDVTLLREILDTTAGHVSEVRDPQVQAEIRLTLGRTYLAIALHEEAVQNLRAAVEARRSYLAAQHPMVLEAERLLGDALIQMGSYDAARLLLSGAVTRARASRIDGPDWLKLLNSLATVEEVRGGTGNSAERLYREALDFAVEVLGEEHLSTATARGNLAQYLMNHERADEAEALLRRALPTFRREREACPSCLSTTLHNLAGTLVKRSHYKEAEALYREALDILRHGWRDHPRTATTLDKLATALELQGDLDSAETSFRQALAMRRRFFGNEHRNVGTSANNLARLLRKRGRYPESIVLFHQAAGIYRRALGPEHAWVAIVLGNLSIAYEAQGDYESALSTAEEQRRIGLRYWPQDHWRLAVADSVRGRSLVERGRKAEGTELLKTALSTLERQLGVHHEETCEARERLLRSLDARNLTSAGDSAVQ